MMEDLGESLNHLSAVFPTISQKVLQRTLESCHGDLQNSVILLLDKEINEQRTELLEAHTNKYSVVPKENIVQDSKMHYGNNRNSNGNDFKTKFNTPGWHAFSQQQVKHGIGAFSASHLNKNPKFAVYAQDTNQEFPALSSAQGNKTNTNGLSENVSGQNKIVENSAGGGKLLHGQITLQKPSSEGGREKDLPKASQHSRYVARADVEFRLHDSVVKEDERNKRILDLSKRFPRGDPTLFSDLLNALGDSVELAEECLRGMGVDAESEDGQPLQDLEQTRAHITSTNVSYKSWQSPNELPSGICDGQVHASPNFQKEDIYAKHRKGANKMARARDRHSKGAMNAFLMGDHIRAKELSNMARKEKLLADALNLEAAHHILHENNSNRHGGLWEIDLHGLHGNEAVAALSERLRSIEEIPLETWESLSGKSTNLVAASKFSHHRPELSVITGQGNHSRGGPTLPSTTATYLAQHGYCFRHAKAGVLAVRPKFKYTSF